MATRRRKKLTPQARRADDPLLYKQFARKFLAGRIRALQLFESRDNRGRLELEYTEDDN